MKKTIKKLPPKKVVKSIASYLDSMTQYGESIRIIEILRAIAEQGYDFNLLISPNGSAYIKGILQEMGWKLNKIHTI